MSGAGALDGRTVRRLSRAISTVEDCAAGYQEILSGAYRAPAKARVIGVTGPPGAGKSTLVDALTAHWAGAGERVAVLAVDPSSPFSGGAVLGDRVRMDRSSDLPGVYLRSISARGEGGGLSAAVCDIVALLDEAEFDRVVIETVGAGQADIAVADAADCTLVVFVPGLGDDIQAAKAGLMEVGDVYAVNKGDLPGAKATVAEINGAIGVAYAGTAGVNQATPALTTAQPASSPGRLAVLSRHGDPARDGTLWRPPVQLVSARSGDGVPDLAQMVDAFLGWCGESGRLALRRRSRIRAQMLRTLSAALIAPYLQNAGEAAEALAGGIKRVLASDTSPAEAVAELVRRDSR
jgi:LAO/AO transport system kinase